MPCARHGKKNPAVAAALVDRHSSSPDHGYGSFSIYLIFVSSTQRKQLHAQRKGMPEWGLITGLYYQMLTLKFLVNI
ncbi:hypothetical protein D3C72_2289850 [compost metagenome]